MKLSASFVSTGWRFTKSHCKIVLEDVDFCLADDVLWIRSHQIHHQFFLSTHLGEDFCWFIFSFCIHVPVAANPSWESTHVRLTTTWVSSLKSRRIWKRRWKDFKGKMGGLVNGEKENAVEGECSWIWLHPWKLTCPLKMDYFSREYIFPPLIFKGHICCWLVIESFR